MRAQGVNVNEGRRVYVERGSCAANSGMGPVSGRTGLNPLVKHRTSR